MLKYNTVICDDRSVNKLELTVNIAIKLLPYTFIIHNIHILILFQALIFWVVDNFLKKKVFKKPKSNLTPSENGNSSQGGGVKFFKDLDRAKYFPTSMKNDDSESDVLLSLDEDIESGARYRGSENPLNRSISDSDGGSSQYGLLSPAINT